MWILSLKWLLLAVCVLWAIGAFKRLKRLRHECKQAFIALDAQYMQLIDWLRSCARVQMLQEKVAGVHLDDASQALSPSADALDSALLQVRQQPLQAEGMVALEAAWQDVQLAWMAYMQHPLGQPTGVHDAQRQEWALRWQQLTTLHAHSTAQFNAAVNHYNSAIAQFPACAVARLSGLKSVRNFQKDAASLMQPSA